MQLNLASLVPEFLENLKKQRLDFETVAEGDTGAFRELVTYLNSAENQTYITVPVVIKSSDNGNQNSRALTTNDGSLFYRSNGEVAVTSITAFSKYLERQERGGRKVEDFYLLEPIREVTNSELLSGVVSATMVSDVEEVGDLDDLV